MNKNLVLHIFLCVLFLQIALFGLTYQEASGDCISLNHAANYQLWPGIEMGQQLPPVISYTGSGQPMWISPKDHNMTILIATCGCNAAHFKDALSSAHKNGDDTVILLEVSPNILQLSRNKFGLIDPTYSIRHSDTVSLGISELPVVVHLSASGRVLGIEKAE